jgi:hypothetical protein
MIQTKLAPELSVADNDVGSTRVLQLKAQVKPR